MRSFILCASSICALASHAVAADLPNRAAPPVFVPPVVPMSWAGCYVGGFGAVDIAKVRNAQTDTIQRTTTITPTGAPATTARTTRQTTVPYGRTYTGGDGGGRFGCNYQTGALVIGAQLEGGYLGVNGSAINPIRTTSLSQISGGAYGAFSVKLGYTLFDRTLLFVRGGVGYADLRYRANDSLLNVNASSRGSQAIPLVGAGLEYKITPQVSLTGEYTYMRPGCRSPSYNVPASTTTTTSAAGVTTASTVSGSSTDRSCVDKHMISLGLNYYFTPSITPVVARY